MGKSTVKVVLFFTLWVLVTWLRTVGTDRQEFLWYALLAGSLSCGILSGWFLKELIERYWK